MPGRATICISMKKYIISFITEDEMVMLNYVVEATSLVEALGEMDIKPHYVLSVVVVNK